VRGSTLKENLAEPRLHIYLHTHTARARCVAIVSMVPKTPRKCSSSAAVTATTTRRIGQLAAAVVVVVVVVVVVATTERHRHMSPVWNDGEHWQYY
jgi:hypothetical protein